jgi:hypothetical protein
MALSRRSFLGLGLGGAAVLAVAGLGLLPTTLRPSATPLRVLSPRAFSVLAAVADRICPGDGAFPSASELRVAESIDALLAVSDPSMGAELRVAESIDALLAVSDPSMGAEIGQALLLLDNALAGLLLDGRPTTFTGASPEAQDATLAAWATSSLVLRRKVFKALRGLVAGAYYGNPRVYAAVGYPGPPDFSAAADAELPPAPAATEGVP